MEAIVPAFLLAVLSQIGDRPALLTAILADRYGRPLTIAFAAGLAHAGLNFAAAFAGMAVAPMMTPNAKALLLAIALISGGLFGFGGKLKDRLEGWKMGALVTPLLGVLVLAFGERTQFFTFALATRGEPWFAATGATIGAFAIGFVAAVLGERAWQGIPLRWPRISVALAFLGAGAWIGLGALRLV